MNTQENPFPWRLFYGKIIDSNGNTVCILPSRQSNESANLICAAPDLLSAVDSCVEIMTRAIGERLPINRGTECEETDWLAAIRKAREALRKAKGAE